MLTRAVIDEFWTLVRKGPGPDDCWLFVGKTDRRHGYGRFFVPGAGSGRGRHGKGRVVGAHVLSWELANGEVPRRPSGRKYPVCHTCDTPACVRPAHLFAGTDVENSHDAVLKGKFLHRSKITPAQAVEFRQRFADGTATKAELAREAGVNLSSVRALLRGQTHRAWTGGDRLTGAAAMRGEDAANAKLNWPLVREMRRLHREEGWGAKRSAKHFGIHRTTARDILRGDAWREAS